MCDQLLGFVRPPSDPWLTWRPPESARFQNPKPAVQSKGGLWEFGIGGSRPKQSVDSPKCRRQSRH